MVAHFEHLTVYSYITNVLETYYFILNLPNSTYNVAYQIVILNTYSGIMRAFYFIYICHIRRSGKYILQNFT